MQKEDIVFIVYLFVDNGFSDQIGLFLIYPSIPSFINVEVRAHNDQKTIYG